VEYHLQERPIAPGRKHVQDHLERPHLRKSRLLSLLALCPLAL
jgi:hypothetical protein